MDDMKDMKNELKKKVKPTKQSAMDKLAEATAKAEAASKEMRAKKEVVAEGAEDVISAIKSAAGKTAVAGKSEPTTYTVVSGDSLSKIAAKLYDDGSKWQALYKANKETIGDNPDRIRVGQVLTVPDLK